MIPNFRKKGILLIYMILWHVNCVEQREWWDGGTSTERNNKPGML